ncbi:Flagellar protein YcgR [Vibrio sp. B1FIG11]|uniref:flagellar brake domain-containing protein n=1 Tax=Vibrio sp. B1FIG11 TaxID=2751177 RepID=UPI001AF5596B|nr:flagellar brake domain-containing protein [Vibrio sp. B1FIG11]CAD7821743.1 Flagellar protein YcgR [Vibrio sp. B1FIG11]CAE6944786.1 Flagellar protein YcgR [Vibrio sp. B1FIG11]
MPSTHTNDELHKFLKTGMRVSINFEFGPEEKYIYAATYLGLKENAYIILDIPTRLLEEQALRKLNNVDVVIRGVSDTDLGHVVAFKTSVLMNLLRPSPLLFVRIPATFATKPVRGHIDAENRCSVANIKKLQKGWIVGVKFAEPLNMTDDLKNELWEHSFSASTI